MKPKLLFMLSIGLISAGSVNSQDSISTDSLNKLYISAQSKNQLSQADYYANQRRGIDTQWLTLIGALGGSIIGLLGAFIIANNNRKGEIQKLNKRLQDERTKNMKLAAAELIKKTAEGFHSLTWVLWIAKNTPDVCTSGIVDEHDKKMNKLYSEIAGAQVVLAAYSKKLYEDTEPIVRYLYTCDGELARTAHGLSAASTSGAAIAKLGGMWQGIYDYSREIPKKFADSLEIVLSQKAEMTLR